MDYISRNIKRLRSLKGLTQKEVAMNVTIPQGQYSRIESGKVIPTIPTLQKLAALFEVSLSELMKEKGTLEEELNLPLLEKIKKLNELEEDEKSAIVKLIDIALSKKRMKDNLTNILAS